MEVIYIKAHTFLLFNILHLDEGGSFLLSNTSNNMAELFKN